LIFVLLPIVALISALGIGALHFFTPAQVRAAHIPSKFAVAIAITVLGSVAGNMWLDPRVRTFRENPSQCQYFDSEQDRDAAVTLKVITIVVCGLVVPTLAVVVTFWSHIWGTQ
jgi:hypothetical protein